MTSFIIAIMATGALSAWGVSYVFKQFKKGWNESR